MLMVTTHASKSMAPRRRSVLDLSISNLLTPRASRGRRRPARTSQSAFVRDTRTHPATGGSGGEPTGGMSGAAGGTAGGGGGAMYSCAGTHAQ